MTTTTVTPINFPPRGFQLRTGAGTLNSASIPRPVATMPLPNGSAPVNPATSGSLAAPLRVTFYDTNSASLNTPIASINLDNGFTPQTLNASYTSGLYMVCATPSDVSVTTTP